ncbi:MAG: formate--tetrahydrofolate ligase [Candidatus Sericytochromatia bacterium]|nr:formate--tetrahydrofolate ligase [Candidatus Sericytochromatia bacterium]
MPTPVPCVPDDLAIAEATPLEPITRIAAGLGLEPDDLELYGRHKAKLGDEAWARVQGRPDGKLVLVTAISPTPAGEGKTTVTIGLSQALCRLGERAVAAVREPSLGPVFGVKGGATGGGHAQVLPMADINLHFTGDFHAVTAANNLLAALIDNHLHQGNALRLDPRRITFSRVLDVNDRALREVVVGLGGLTGGVPRQAGFMITPASEVMAVLCLAADAADLRRRLGDIIVGFDVDGAPVCARSLGADGAMAVLLKDAFKPNLVQTTEHTPALVHGGPFANIAHGCNTLVATRMALKLGDWVVTEAGFGADLGAEKFLDIKCRVAGLRPDVVVLVATVRSLKMHGGVRRTALHEESLAALEAGAANLERHLRNVQEVYGLPCVVALNRFASDTDAELAWLTRFVEGLGATLALCEVHGRGGAGGEVLARAVQTAAAAGSSRFAFVYDDEDTPLVKLRKVATRVYGADDVVLSRQAEQELARLVACGFARAPVCIAKTQTSFSDDPTRLGAPTGWVLHVREVRGAAGAGFIVALTGDVMTMPGLPAEPAATRIGLDAEGRISGLF